LKGALFKHQHNLRHRPEREYIGPGRVSTSAGSVDPKAESRSLAAGGCKIRFRPYGRIS